MGLSHSPRIVTDGLVLCLDAGNAKSYPGSGTTWTDLSTNRVTAVLSGTSYNAALKAITFSSGGATLPRISDFSPNTNPFTIEAYAYPTVLNLLVQRFIGKGTNGDNTAEYSFSVNTTGHITFATSSNGQVTTASVGSAAQISLNTWSYVAVTRQGATAKIYINGNLDRTGTVNTFTFTSASTNTKIAISDTGNQFTGSLSQIKMYNRALTDAEVQQNFNALRGRFGI